MSGSLLFPGEPGSEDPEVVGGKAANLAILTRLEAPVPRFFAIRASASRQADGRVETALAAELDQALGRLGRDKAVSVRSSAVGEDSAGASFAGVFETVLDVRGGDEVVAAVERCWASLEGRAAGGYSALAQVSETGGMGVVIQEMAETAWSGVCFTADPALLAVDRVVIDGSRAGADAVVSGEVTPARAVVRADSGVLLESTAEDGGEELPASVRAAVWRESVRIAGEFGFPQDIEWAAAADGSLRILQSRPITTLGAVFANRELETWAANPGTVDDPQRDWTRVYGDEVWTAPVSPLFYTLHNQAGNFEQQFEWFGARSELPRAIQKYHRAAAYFDVGMLAGFYEFLPPVARVPSILALFPSDEGARLRRAPWRWRGWLRRTATFELRERRRYSLADNDRALKALWPRYDSYTERWGVTEVEKMSADEAWQHSREVARLSTPVMELSAVMITHAFDLKCLLVGLLESWVGDSHANYAAVSTGLQGANTVEEAEALWKFAQEIRGDERLAELVAEGAEWPRFRAVAADLAPDLVARFEAFVFRHRHRGANYKDVIFPRWGDDPEIAFAVLRAYVKDPIAQPTLGNEARARERVAAQQRVLGSVGGLLGAPKRSVLRWLFRYNARYQHLRDDYRFRFDHIWFECRRVYGRIGVLLVEAGCLDDAEDVYFLGHRELRRATAGKLGREDLLPRIEVRRREWEKTREDLPPKFLRAYAPTEERSEVPQDGDALFGIAASPGVVRGRARVVRDLDEADAVGVGEIVVTRRTDPGWTSLFPRLGGLVLETGGVLSHGASLCREFDLPCVTAVESATDRIVDGSEIEVLGSSGQVRIIGTGGDGDGDRIPARAAEPKARP
jgi:pyruvate,water dikinase